MVVWFADFIPCLLACRLQKPADKKNGQRYARKVVEQRGAFLCPVCLQRRRYKEKSVQPAWNPLNGLSGHPSDPSAERYVKCGVCFKHFDPVVLQWGQPDQGKVLEIATLVGISKIVGAQGDLSEASIDRVSQIYESISGMILSNEEIASILDSRPSSGDTSLDFIVYRRLLDDDKKDRVLRAVLAAVKKVRQNGQTDNRRMFLVVAEIARGLGLSLYETETAIAEIEARIPSSPLSARCAPGSIKSSMMGGSIVEDAPTVSSASANEQCCESCCRH